MSYTLMITGSLDIVSLAANCSSSRLRGCDRQFNKRKEQESKLDIHNFESCSLWLIEIANRRVFSARDTTDSQNQGNE